MKGIRVEYTGSGPLPEKGSYWKLAGIWWAMTPNGGFANLGNHQVEENVDGTITVKPSILVRGFHEAGELIWHGYLISGEWEEC